MEPAPNADRHMMDSDEVAGGELERACRNDWLAPASGVRAGRRDAMDVASTDDGQASRSEVSLDGVGLSALLGESSAACGRSSDVDDSGQADGREPLWDRKDDQLMLLARDGLHAAFDALVRRHQRRVLVVAARLIGNWSLAPDIAQDTFLRVYRALPSYRPCGRFPAYLNRVLINVCRMAQRGRRTDDRGRRTLWHIPVEPVASVDADIILRERQFEVEHALNGLSARLRVVAILRYSGGLSLAEIADTLSIPLGTVKRRLFEAMCKLREAVDEDDLP